MDGQTGCKACGATGLGRKRTVRGYAYGRCVGCRVWRLLASDAAPPPPREARTGGDEVRVGVFAWTVAELEEWTPPGRLVDVGCGPGHLLEASCRRGWDVTGVEPDGASAERARALFGFEPLVSEWRAGVVPDGSADAVVLHHVLEHLPDPRAALAAARAALRPSGVLHVAVPNVRTVDRLLSRTALEEIFDPPRHLWAFSDRTLPPLVERAGFTVVRSRPQLSNALQRLVARERVAATTGARGETGRPSARGRLLRAAAGTARTIAPGSAVRLFALRPDL